MHIECQPTIEMRMRVDMGGGSSESNAEAWAVGERHGVPVDENDQTYHNNAKWYAEKSAQAAAEVVEAVESYDEITAEATRLAAGSAPTAEMDHSGSAPVLRLGIPAGDRGPTGATPNIGIGTVSTGAPGTDASASMTGTPEAPVLNLTIPRGNPGEVTQAELDEAVDELKVAINVLKPAATASDVGKFLKVKTVADGVPTSFEYGEGGSGGNVIDDTAGTGVTNKTWSANKLTEMIGDIETLLAAI